MFNKKYKEEIELQKRKIEKLEDLNKKLVNEIKEISEENNNNPDCVRGKWCKSCGFYSEHGIFGHCTKGRCSSFIPKEKV